MKEVLGKNNIFEEAYITFTKTSIYQSIKNSVYFSLIRDVDKLEGAAAIEAETL